VPQAATEGDREVKEMRLLPVSKLDELVAWFAAPRE
jgi:hypothetical protein